MITGIPSIDKSIVRHSSRIDLSLGALQNNVSFVRNKIGADPIISAVVKSNAYGHGTQHFVSMLIKCGIKHFSVASSYEAQEVLRSCLPDCEIMIMGILYSRDLEWVIYNNIQYYVFDLERIRQSVEAAKRVGKKAVIHLEVETGGNRTGLPIEQMQEALDLIEANAEHIDFRGLCTHLAGAETLANHFRIRRQMIRYNEAYETTQQKNVLPKLRHIASSAAGLTIPEARMDMVRVGIALYGLWPSPDVYNMHLVEINQVSDNPLHRVISWKTDIMHLKDVNEGEFVGYGTSYQALRNMKVAVIPLGYANGYSRSLSNKGFVLIHGKRANICGLINMNLFMVDVTHIEGVEVGDEVILIGNQDNSSITISSFSDFANQLNNELMSRLPADIPRQIVD
ncbi:alanine racemase [Catalinimonas alkaloidigena]|uniref:alanine racemase n=1 Tax=Catalinimonas alkaloidigena TaxID=1075417 RepID=UPI0024061345|nr:alanine racemase [Catalinimonas alkaloidigena]MDF9799851.1 alanine racemase [Catalinimonas alkaloidigena]